MNFFDQWVAECQKVAKTFTETTDWQAYESTGALVAGEAKLAEKAVQQQARFYADSADQYSQHCLAMLKKTDLVNIAESNYSFFCEQQIRVSNMYLGALDLASEAKGLVDQHVNKAFTR